MPAASPRKPHRRPPAASLRPFLLAYAFTVMAFFLLSFVPHGRVWGLNSWAWLPLWGRLLLLIAAAAAPLGALRLSEPSAPAPGRRGAYALAAGLAGIVLFAAFLILRQQTHFLGDGYTLLKWLEEGGAINKMRNFGAQFTLLLADRVLPGGALEAFRIVAWTSGAVAVAAALTASAALFSELPRRLLFACGVLSGGYALLFFGYVENYALFVLMVLLFCWAGLLAVRGRISPWWILLPQAGAVFFHVFGVTLLPAAAYAVLRTTPLGRRVARLPLGTRGLMIAGLAAAGLAAFVWFYTHSYFFRFTFVPILPNRFTIRGYTMFSLSHLVDVANLLLILAPALGLFAVAKFRTGVRRIIAEPSFRFLGLAALGALGAAFIFDPKLGMPRDWDLFSYGGVPLTMAGMLLLLEGPKPLPKPQGLAALAVALALLALVPRVIVQHTPPLAIAQFEAYRDLDPVQNRNGAIFLVDYYERRGDTARAEELRTAWHKAQTDEPLLMQGNAALQSGAFRRALDLYRAALRENPVYWVAWANLGDAYLRMGRRDSALEMYRIADGLNPSSPIILSNLGQAWYLNGQAEKGVELWQRSASLDPEFLPPLRFLVNHYRTSRDRDNYLAVLERIARLDGAPADNLAALADWYVQSNRFADAGRLYERALAAGLDSAYVSEMMAKYPVLREEFPAWHTTSTAF
ncbi:MAG TPA: tetratricopeptide repeat protein [candidate division Zixibacteria bacterium]|nr:tetratricopeptide repeat protein [candidate division Zixibacteria bacterium]MDD4917748.1 tetratricopeptide repeat protein [candidate division Zixibacteria bacterium]MDM7972789.1 tetratricopeptide repeat protein [candidate division Zixibacteria bacterium]HOD67422.1 tetratricopeptide repeat protein [candidate division Zixibacteria bacterium]HOZ07184.1 tetratricopeptide repeat protein [candidate division Zixibacteria bacterium]